MYKYVNIKLNYSYFVDNFIDKIDYLKNNEPEPAKDGTLAKEENDTAHPRA